MTTNHTDNGIAGADAAAFEGHMLRAWRRLLRQSAGDTGLFGVHTCQEVNTDTGAKVWSVNIFDRRPMWITPRLGKTFTSKDRGKAFAKACAYLDDANDYLGVHIEAIRGAIATVRPLELPRFYPLAGQKWRDDIGDPGIHDIDPATLNSEESQ